MRIEFIKAFVPSGDQYERSREFFRLIGFELAWSVDGLCELRFGDAAFLLQKFSNKEMQENLMLAVKVDDLDQFYAHLVGLNLAEKFPEVRFGEPKLMPWGDRELHLIDLAGVCWHFG